VIFIALLYSVVFEILFYVFLCQEWLVHLTFLSLLTIAEKIQENKN